MCVCSAVHIFLYTTKLCYGQIERRHESLAQTLAYFYFMNIEFLSNWKSQTKKGLITFLVLKIIKSKSCYGSEIIKQINAQFEFDVAEGTLYPILKKLKAQKLVMTNWKTEEDDIGAPKKFYLLTGEGKLMLDTMDMFWKELNSNMYATAS